jgi:hypothetical protein
MGHRSRELYRISVAVPTRFAFRQRQLDVRVISQRTLKGCEPTMGSPSRPSSMGSSEKVTRVTCQKEGKTCLASATMEDSRGTSWDALGRVGALEVISLYFCLFVNARNESCPSNFGV